MVTRKTSRLGRNGRQDVPLRRPTDRPARGREAAEQSSQDKEDEEVRQRPQPCR